MHSRDLLFSDAPAKNEPTFSWVHLVSLQMPHGAPHVIATCILHKGTVAIEGDPAFVLELQQGLRAGPDYIVFPADGERFLASLIVQYRHPYLFATPIHSGEAVAPYHSSS